MKLLPKNIPKTIVLPALAITLLLCGIARICGCGKARPRMTMAQLDSRAQKYIDEANAGIPRAVSTLCDRRNRLLWMVLKDKCTGKKRAAKFIASVIEPTVLAPLRKAAARHSNSRRRCMACSRLSAPLWRANCAECLRQHRRPCQPMQSMLHRGMVPPSSHLPSIQWSNSQCHNSSQCRKTNTGTAAAGWPLQSSGTTFWHLPRGLAGRCSRFCSTAR